jgi:hypothetical protein
MGDNFTSKASSSAGGRRDSTEPKFYLWYSNPRARQREVRLYVEVKEIKEILARSLSQRIYDRMGRGERGEGAEDPETSFEEWARCQSVFAFLLLRDSAAQATSLSLNLAS